MDFDVELGAVSLTPPTATGQFIAPLPGVATPRDPEVIGGNMKTIENPHKPKTCQHFEVTCFEDQDLTRMYALHSVHAS